MKDFIQKKDIFMVLINKIEILEIFLYSYSKHTMNNPSDSYLDISWINEQQRIQNIQNNYCRENVEEINVYSLYINKDSYIDKITCKKQPVINNCISRDSVLGIIQTNKTSASKKYKLSDVLVYHVDL